MEIYLDNPFFLVDYLYLDLDEYIDLNEEDIFNIFGRRDLGIPIYLKEEDIFNVFKFIGIGISFELTKSEVTDIVLCLKRIRINKKHKITKKDNIKILITEDENGKILLN